MEEKSIDQNLYSRQLFTFGMEAQGKLVKMKVFLYGLRGLGVETAKNLILAGPNKIVIHDDHLTEINDLASNFYLKESDVGKRTRAEACLDQLKNLNLYVNVEIHKGEIHTDFLKEFDVVTFTDFYDLKQLINFNKFCRENKKGFVMGGSLGLYGFTFIDYGESFKIFDKTGEDPRSTIVVSITNDENGVVTVHEDKKHRFVTGDHVTFTEVEGMEEINGKTYEIKVISPFSFSIGDTRSFSPYKREGIATQVKVPTEIKFKSLENSLDRPNGCGKQELDVLDYSKQPEQSHVTLLGLFRFYENNGHLPRLNNKEDADLLFKLTKTVNEELSKTMEIENDKPIKLENINEEYVKNVALFARAQISSNVSFWGGIIAQEIVKYTGKFTPLNQWLHYDTFESLPEVEVNREPMNSRYDDVIAIYGQEIFKKLTKYRVFLVGAGALGCEYIKVLALTGVATEEPGLLMVTDDDNIEISNLNRQFLFRKQDVGKSKSERALEVGVEMNPKLRTKSYKSRVNSENEVIFNDDFWESLDLVLNAVDNVPARLFVDGRCVFYNKPLIESGTLGTKCNSQIIVPKMTQSYGETSDPPEESIPLCTLKNFPHLIEHTIQWARDYFEGNFVEGPNECRKFMENPQNYLQQSQKELEGKVSSLRGRLETIDKLVTAFQFQSFETCIELARAMFEENFHIMIAQLLYSFPLDHKTEQGQLFWSGPKRPPQVLDYNPDDAISLGFVAAAANIFAFIFGLDYCRDMEKIRVMSKSVDPKNLPKFQPKKLKITGQNQEVKEESGEDDEKVIALLVEKLQKFKPFSKKVNIVEFEKDDDSNCHIDFIAATANLRARNYKIQEVDRLKIKFIAGKIIPAIATTTAMIVGAASIEIYKLALEKKLDFIKNAFINLALPLFLFTEPCPPNQQKDKEYDPILLGPIKAIPSGFTVWDKKDIKGPMKLRDFFDYIDKNDNVTISLVSAGKVCLYNKYSNDAKMKERLNRDVKELLESLTGKPFPEHKKFIELEISGETKDGIDAVMPTIRYSIR